MTAPVLAAADPQATDHAAVRFAALVAGHTGAPLTIAAVHGDPDAFDPLTAGQNAEPLPPSPSRVLEDLRAEAEVAGATADTLWIAATTAPRGLDLAAGEAGAGLLAVGRGHTAERLLAGAPCAVAVVPSGWSPPAGDLRVGVGFVDSAEGHAAVHGAHALASRAGARLRILAAVRPLDRTHDADVRARAEQAAEAAVSGLLGAPVDVDVDLVEPAEALLRATRELDVLVCGARGYGANRGTAVGGVTRRLVAEAACPVIVLAHEPDVALEALTA
jgi:nucleotide-binding universal stress UspA family protein